MDYYILFICDIHYYCYCTFLKTGLTFSPNFPLRIDSYYYYYYYIIIINGSFQEPINRLLEFYTSGYPVIDHNQPPRREVFFM